MKFKMDNNSNKSFIFSESPYVKLSILPAFFLIIFVFVVNILILMAIIMEKTMPGTVRLVLGNIVVASEVVIIGGSIWAMGSLIPSIMESKPSEFVCRLSYVMITSGAAGRLLFMATYAVTVYVLARYVGTNLREVQLRFWPSLLAVVVVWVFASIPNMIIFSDEFLRVNFTTTYKICTAHGRDPTAYIYPSCYIIVYCVLSAILSIIFPLLTVQYIKKNTVKEIKKTMKRMCIFTVFLLVLSSINIISVTLSLVLLTFLPIEDIDRVTQFFAIGISCFLVSLISTPIIYIIFFKTLRQRLISILCFFSLQIAAKEDSKTTSA